MALNDSPDAVQTTQIHVLFILWNFCNYFHCYSGFFTRIIHSRYQDICESVRTSVIDIFFEETFLEMYSKQKLNQQIIRLNIEGHLQRILQSETIDQLISTELHRLVMSPEGQLLSFAGIELSSLRLLVKPYVVELLTDVVPVVVETFTSYTQVGRFIIASLDVLGNVQHFVTNFFSWSFWSSSTLPRLVVLLFCCLCCITLSCVVICLLFVSLVCWHKTSQFSCTFVARLDITTRRTDNGSISLTNSTTAPPT